MKASKRTLLKTKGWEIEVQLDWHVIGLSVEWYRICDWESQGGDNKDVFWFGVRMGPAGVIFGRKLKTGREHRRAMENINNIAGKLSGSMCKLNEEMRTLDKEIQGRYSEAGKTSTN